MRNLKVLRKEHSLSQIEFAEAINSAQTTVSQWERGTREPDIETITRIANFFDVSTDYLLGKSDMKKSTSKEGESDDVGVLMDTLLDKLKTEDTIMFNGYTMNRETAELLAASLAAADELTARLLEEKKRKEG